MAEPRVPKPIIRGRTVIKGGRVDRPTGERVADVAIGRGRSHRRGRRPTSTATVPIVLDAGGCIVAPGLVDLHTHLREPGRRKPRPSRRARGPPRSAGSPPSSPCPTPSPTIDWRRGRARCSISGKAALGDVHVAGAITVGRRGEQLAPMAEMADLGVRIFTDDGSGVQDDRLMRRALEYAVGLGVTLAQHCEVESLVGGRPHARGGVVVPARHPRHPGRGRGAHGDPRHRPGPAHRRRGALPAPVDRGLGRAGAPGQGRAAAASPPRPGPTTSRSPTPRSRATTRCSR